MELAHRAAPALPPEAAARWRVLHHLHCGGAARPAGRQGRAGKAAALQLCCMSGGLCRASPRKMSEESIHLHALLLPFAMADCSSVVGARNGAHD